jgi:hypothetical protein
MKFNYAAALGSIIGWFIISPLFRPLPYFEISLLDMLQRGIMGLLLAIFLGLFFGLLDDYFEAKLEHEKIMKEYLNLKEKMNGQLNTKK